MFSSVLLACCLTLTSSDVSVARQDGLSQDMAQVAIEDLACLRRKLGLNHPTVVRKRKEIEVLVAGEYEPDLMVTEKRLQQLVAERAEMLVEYGNRHPKVVENSIRILVVSRTLAGEFPKMLDEFEIETTNRESVKN